MPVNPVHGLRMHNEWLRLRHIDARPGGTLLDKVNPRVLLVAGKYVSGTDIP